MIKLTSEQVEQYIKGTKYEGADSVIHVNMASSKIRFTDNGQTAHLIVDAKLNAARAIALEELVGKLVGALNEVTNIVDCSMTLISDAADRFYPESREFEKRAKVGMEKAKANLAAARELGVNTTESEGNGQHR